MMIKTKLGYYGLVLKGDELVASYLPKKDYMDLQYQISNDFRNYFLVQKKSDEPIAQKIVDYFKGINVDFSDIVIDPIGSDFEKSVWRACAMIPYSEVRSYSWIAEKIGNPKSSRAVGNALNKNPLPIIVPCHRVVGSNGIGGFAGGIELKRKLLEIELH